MLIDARIICIVILVLLLIVFRKYLICVISRMIIKPFKSACITNIFIGFNILLTKLKGFLLKEIWLIFEVVILIYEFGSRKIRSCDIIKAIKAIC